MSVIVLSLACVAGIYLGTLGAPPTTSAALLVAASIAMAGLWWRVTAVRLVALGVAVVILAMARAQSAQPDGAAFGRFVDHGTVSVRGIVADAPVAQQRGMELRLAVHEAKADGEDWQTVDANVVVSLPYLPSWHYGDYLELKGTLETPPNFDRFAYREYLARQGVAALSRYPKVTPLGKRQAWAPLQWVNDARAALGAALGAALPEPQAALAQGVLLGQRGNIPADLTDSFARTNTTHVIAISGTNVTLVIGMLFFVGGRLFGRRSGTILAIAGVLFYALLVGAGPSVARATLMGIIFAIGGHLGRQRDASAALAVTAALMTLWDPMLIFDLGFQLSFLATAGLVLLVQPAEHLLRALPGWLRSLLAVTIAAEMMTMPLVVIYSGQISLVGPLANLAVPPLLPLVMIASGVTAVVGLLSSTLANVVGAVSWLFLTTMIDVVQWLGQLPGAAVPIGQPGSGFVIAYYGLLGGLLLHKLSPTTDVQRAWHALWGRLPTVPTLGALAIGTALVWSAVFSLPASGLHLLVLDVGQGDAILIQTPRHNVLVDGGPNPNAIANALGRRLPFWRREIDLVVLTHPNEDHLAGLIAVLERFPVRQVLETGIGEATPTYERWNELLKSKAIQRYVAVAGEEIALGDGVTLAVLNPPEGVTSQRREVNDTSVVMRLSSGSFRALLTGDAGAGRLRELEASGVDLRATVLKVPHHGSRGGLDPAVVAAIAPQVAIISVGQGNRFGHPAPETVKLLEDAGAAVYRTDTAGTAQIDVSGDRYVVVTQR